MSQLPLSDQINTTKPEEDVVKKPVFVQTPEDLAVFDEETRTEVPHTVI